MKAQYHGDNPLAGHSGNEASKTHLGEKRRGCAKNMECERLCIEELEQASLTGVYGISERRRRV